MTHKKHLLLCDIHSEKRGVHFKPKSGNRQLLWAQKERRDSCLCRVDPESIEPREGSQPSCHHLHLL